MWPVTHFQVLPIKTHVVAYVSNPVTFPSLYHNVADDDMIIGDVE